MKSLAAWRNLTHTIRFRLVLWFTLILGGVLLVFSTLIYFSQDRDIHSEERLRLESRMADLQVVLAAADRPTTLPLREGEVFVLSGSEQVLLSQGVQSTAEAGELLQRAQQRAHDPWRPPEDYAMWVAGRRGQKEPYLYLAKPLANSASGEIAILGAPFDTYQLSHRLLGTLLLGCGLTLAIALGGGLWLAERAMRPVSLITQAARSISESDLNRRLNLAGSDELSELADTFDTMLARLQAAFERQRQFVADASHELRTPLTIVHLEASRALAAPRSSAEYQQALQTIQSENRVMTRLVNDLLTLTRMDMGQMQIEKSMLDLSDVALEALERLISLATRNGVALTAGELPETPLYGDRQYLLQLVSNLIENSIKYSAGADRRVWVATGHDDTWTWLRVTDNGLGIPAEHLPHIFERFYRVDKARARSSDDALAGSGLGLSIVQWIAQAHDGQVQIESTPGIGTVCTVRFKVASSSSSAQTSDEPHPSV